MNRARRHLRRTARTRRAALGFLLLALPTLIVAPLLSSGMVLLHEHGAEAHHGHLLPLMAEVADHHLVVAMHEAQHGGHEHGEDGQDDHGSEQVPVPADSLSGLPPTSWKAVGSAPSLVGNLLPQRFGALMPAVPAAPEPMALAQTRLGRMPPDPSNRHGAERVVRCNHALLI